MLTVRQRLVFCYERVSKFTFLAMYVLLAMFLFSQSENEFGNSSVTKVRLGRAGLQSLIWP